MLEMRGVTSEASDEEINSWLAPDLHKMLDSLDLGTGCLPAADTIRGIKDGADVVVYGDYDVDGISSTAIAIEIALAKHARVRYFIPHRFNQGYGLHADVVQNIVKRKCDLVMVVDCGTQDVDAAAMIRASGIPVVIFDHHLAEGSSVSCDAIVNPQLCGDAAAKRLCAAGVLWCWAWQNEILPEKALYNLLDLVALATVADCVSLGSPLNRALVRAGIDVLKSNPRHGLEILMRKLGIDPYSVNTEDLAMKIIPCLNAAGRLYLADLAVKLLFPGETLSECADKIIGLNNKRRELSTKILSCVNNSGKDGYRYVLSDKNWSVGVLSSVASRICSERNAPVALVAAAGDIMRGTLRMPAGGDAVGVLKALSPMLKTWGGHRLAAGFSVASDKWPRLRDEMEMMLSAVLVRDGKEEMLHWDPSDLDLKTWQECESLGPFGMDNPYPMFYSSYEGDLKISPIGKNGRHVRIDIGGSSLLGFGAADLINDIDNLTGWVYKPRIDTWRNVTSLQLVLEKMVTK